jgi:hypothetical protein
MSSPGIIQNPLHRAAVQGVLNNTRGTHIHVSLNGSLRSYETLHGQHNQQGSNAVVQ